MNRLHPRFGTVLRRGFRRGFQTVLREKGSKTTLGSLFGILAVTQFLLVCIVGSLAVAQTLRERTDVRVQLTVAAKDADVQRIYGALRTLPFIENVTYVTRDQAYERERKNNPELIAFLEQYRLSNPFADAMVVRLRNADEASSLSQFLQDPAWTAVVDPASLAMATSKQSENAELVLLVSIARSIFFGLLALMLLALFFGLVDLVRRRALSRKEEILVERLSGAQELAILVPLATEGALLLLVDVALTAGLLVCLLTVLPTMIPSLIQGTFESLSAESSALFRLYLPAIFGGEVLLVPFLATLAAWVGMRPLLSSSRLSLGSA